MNIFITHFETFAILQNRRNIARYCVENGISNESGAAIRGSYMEQVLNNKILLEECLKYIIHHAHKAPVHQREKAIRILSELSA